MPHESYRTSLKYDKLIVVVSIIRMGDKLHVDKCHIT
jgi:hypothetical protein